MTTYRVTVTVPAELVDDWQSWMTTVHIADVLATGCFLSARLSVCREPAAEAAVVFVVDYQAATAADYDRYRSTYAAGLQAHHRERYGERVTAQRTLLETVADLADA